MTLVPSPAVGGIRELTEEVIVRTIDTLRAKLNPNELAALEELVTAGTFLDAKAILSAISRAQHREAK